MSKKLIHTDSTYHGLKLVIPFDGEVELDDNGCVTVSDRAAAVLLTMENWELADKDVTKGKGKAGLAKAKAKVEVEPEADNLEEIENEEVVSEEENTEESGAEEGVEIDFKKLKKMSVEELLELAEQTGVKVPAIQKKDAKKLATYLTKKFKEMTADQDE